MNGSSQSRLNWIFGTPPGAPGRLAPRWLFLRALGLIYFSAFFSLVFQIRGLIRPNGILPAGEFLAHVANSVSGLERFWFAPSLLWIASSNHALMALCWVGMAASLLVVANVWPRLTLAVCFVCFLSFVSTASEFSGYQSDGMLLEAGFLALFLAPRGLLPGWGADDPPSRAALFLLLWEWFRIYFESGLVKLLSGDEQWRHLTAMVDYYQNGPLPTWVGWYAAHLPHWFHVTTAFLTLALELVLVFMMFMPRPVRLACFVLVTAWQAGVIVTANYTFLNYLVLALGFLLLDDRAVERLTPQRFRSGLAESPPAPRSTHAAALRTAIAAVMLTFVGYVTTAELLRLPFRDLPLPTAPITALEPFRIANQYGLFAVMTRGRYEIEFQGSNDGVRWTAYPFRYKPQALHERPHIYAPYQPRFDWNLWFASLGDWRQNAIVPITEEKLLMNDRDVLGLFAGNPFAQTPPKYVRAVLWQYWFTSAAEKRANGDWWRRQLLGLYAPEVTRTANGTFTVTNWPEPLPPHD